MGDSQQLLEDIMPKHTSDASVMMYRLASKKRYLHHVE